MPRKIFCVTCGKRCAGKMCRECRKAVSKSNRSLYAREWTLKKKYNLDRVDFETLWNAFRGRCGICQNPMEFPSPGKGQNNKIVTVDHDHATGNIRGLLCSSCNKGLGHFQDDPQLLLNAHRWLTNANPSLDPDPI